MQYALILVREVAVMFLFIAVGAVCVKKKVLDDHSSRAICNLCLLVFTPCMLISSLQQPMDRALLPGMAVSFFLGAALQALPILLVRPLFRDPGDGGVDWKINRLAAVLSNLGFMGYPLLRATVGERALLYGSVMIGIMNVISWVWSPGLLTGQSGAPLRRLVRVPTLCAFVLGLVLFFARLRLPAVPARCLERLGDMTTPASMLMIGAYLVKVDFRNALRDLRMYQVIAIRNILYPLLALGIIRLLRVPAWFAGGRETALTLIILLSCPSAISTILMPSRYGLDTARAAKLVSAGTLACIVTLPLVVMLADLVL